MQKRANSPGLLHWSGMSHESSGNKAALRPGHPPTSSHRRPWFPLQLLDFHNIMVTHWLLLAGLLRKRRGSGLDGPASWGLQSTSTSPRIWKTGDDRDAEKSAWAANLVCVVQSGCIKVRQAMQRTITADRLSTCSAHSQENALLRGLHSQQNVSSKKSIKLNVDFWWSAGVSLGLF